MKAFIVDGYGPSITLRAGQVPDPVIGDGDVLVRILASGVNPLDSKIMAGEFKLILPCRMPFVLGNDLAGVVVQVGRSVRRFAPGDEVYARPDKDRIGTFAELIAVDEGDLARMPVGLTTAEAASLPLVELTAWQALVVKADVRPGQNVLVHAGSGGVGTIAIQLAKHLGAHVATTTSAANVAADHRPGRGRRHPTRGRPDLRFRRDTGRPRLRRLRTAQGQRRRHDDTCPRSAIMTDPVGPTPVVSGDTTNLRRRRAGTASPRMVLLVTSAAAFLSSLDLFIVNIAFPAIRADLAGTDLGDLSWVLNGYTVVFAAFLPLSGRLADRNGHRFLFLLGLAVFTVASAACALAPSVWTLVGARMVQAVGAAFVVPTSLSLLLAAYAPERRSYAVGVWASIGAAAAALGPPVGGLLVQVSWQWVFLVNVPVGVIAFVVGVRVLSDSDRARVGMPDLLGAAGIVVGVGALAFALVRVPDDGWVSGTVIGGVILAVAGLAWVVWRSRRHPVPALDVDVLSVPVVGSAVLVMVAFMTAFGGMLVVSVLYLTGTLGWSEQVAGLGLAAGPAVVVVVSRLSGRLVARIGAGPVALLAAIVFGLGPAWWLVRLDQTPDYWTGFLPGLLLTGLGVGLMLPTLSALVGPARSSVGLGLVVDQHRAPGGVGAGRRSAGDGDRNEGHRAPGRASPPPGRLGAARPRRGGRRALRRCPHRRRAARTQPCREQRYGLTVWRQRTSLPVQEPMSRPGG